MWIYYSLLNKGRSLKTCACSEDKKFPRLSYYFFNFFWAAFFFTICNLFIALSCDSCDVGPFRDGDTLPDSELDLLVLLPPLLAVPPLPFPPVAWLLLLLGAKLLGLGSPTLLTLSLLTERERPVFPRVRGGSGFNCTGLVLLLGDVILDPSPALAVASPDKPMGFWLLDAAAGLPLELCVVDPILAVDGPAEDVFAAKAAQPVRPLAEEEEEETLALVELPVIAPEF